MFNKNGVMLTAAKVIKAAQDDILDFNTRRIVQKRLNRLEGLTGRGASGKRGPLKRLLENDRSAREFFTSGEYEIYADILGMEYDFAMSLYRERL